MAELGKVLIVDIESTCWEQGKQPKDQSSEIIEIGLSLVDTKDLKIIFTDSWLIQPTESQISGFCTTLTGITPNMPGAGYRTFYDSLMYLRNNYNSKKVAWGSWGNYDRKMFQNQCSSRGESYPFSDTHINVKNLFALGRGLEREVGMAEALKYEGMDLIGNHHRAGDDSLNIARLYISLLRDLRRGN
jgi:inhibitor of KinA sporulation pathway (predicted exonuclease)